MTLTTPPTPSGADKPSTEAWVSRELTVDPETPETPEARASRRSAKMKGWFVLFLLMGLLGAALVGYVGSERTAIDPVLLEVTTTHDVGTGFTLFGAGVVTTLLTTLPLLGISFLLDGQADILCAWPDSEEDEHTELTRRYIGR